MATSRRQTVSRSCWSRAAAAIAGLICLAVTPQLALMAQPIFRAGTNLVTVHVSVVGRDAQPVPGLTADRFEVREEGVSQPVAVFADAELPLDVGILIDTSSSMAAAMPMVQAAATQFVGALGTNDRAMVMGLSQQPPVLQPMTADKAALELAIRRAVAHGETPLYVTIYSALRELTGGRKVEKTAVRRQALVVLSDGIDTGKGFDFNELLRIVHSHAVPIYVISPRVFTRPPALVEGSIGRPVATVDFELRRIAADTGGRAFFPRALEELAGIYDDIARELAHQYVLGYYPSEDDAGAEFRRLTVRIDSPGVQWRARAGYVAEP